jgi:hypothetical protein
MYPTGFKETSGSTGQYFDVSFLIPVLHPTNVPVFFFFVENVLFNRSLFKDALR